MTVTLRRVGMNVHLKNLFPVFLLVWAGLALVMGNALANPPAAEAGHVSKTSTPLAGGKPAFKLDIIPDPQRHEEGVFQIRLERTTAPATAEPIGEVIVRWTAPNGQKTSFSIRPVSETVWASQVNLQPGAGKNGVDLLILGKKKDGFMGKATELAYEFELPGAKLTFISAREPLTQSSTATVSGMAGKTSGKPVSIPAIVILVGIFNLLLLLPGLLLVRVWLRFSAKRRRGPVLAQGAALHPLYGKILAGAGLVDRRTGAPLDWGTESEANAGAAGPGTDKEAFEATIVITQNETDGNAPEKSAGTPANDLKKLPTEELVEMVANAIEQFENGKATDDLKELIKAAERELAEREQKQAAAKRDKPRDVRKTGTGSTESRIGDLKIDLNDLSF